MYSNDKITQSIADAVRKVMEEELKGKQHKIDANKNDKIDAHDFELLRKKKKVEEKVVNPYAVGMAAAMKATGDKPPLKKSTIVKAHDIAKKVDEEVEQIDEAISHDSLVAHGDKKFKGWERTSVDHGKPGAARHPDYHTGVSHTWVHPKSKQFFSMHHFDKNEHEAHVQTGHVTPKGKKVAETEGFFHNRDVKAEMHQHHIENKDYMKKKNIKEEVQLSFTDLIESYKTGGLKSFFENFEVDVVEEEATSDEFVAELEKAKRKAAGKEKNEVAKAAVQAVQQEEVEQIDELSKATLGSYVQKASKKAVSHQRSQSDAERTAEIDKKQPLWKKMAKHHFDKKQLKLQGISRAASKLAQEEVEQIDELAPQTYRKLAVARDARARHLSGIAQHPYNRGSSDETHFNKLADRDRAVAKKATAKAGVSHSDISHGNYDYITKKVSEQVELDEMALSADHKAALKTLKNIPSNYSHDDLKKLQGHLSDLHSKASDAERTARHAKQDEVRKANKNRSLKVSHELEGRSANYTNDDGHRLHITRDKNTGGYNAHISNAKGKYVDSGGKTTLMYNHKIGKYAKHFKEEVDHQED